MYLSQQMTELLRVDGTVLDLWKHVFLQLCYRDFFFFHPLNCTHGAELIVSEKQCDISQEWPILHVGGAGHVTKFDFDFALLMHAESTHITSDFKKHT